METGLAAAKATIGAFQAISAAKSKKQIANVDREIEAEKKRDGKSKESLAKIAALEKKKEKMKKKAFETDKKAKMVSVIIDTAAGIAKAVSENPMGAGMPGSAIAAAVGAAQLAVISSSSYEGGGSSVPSAPASSAPDSAGMGKRSNSVDLATSQGAVGELGYMRGGSGVGTANTFRSAFTGSRYRASGGSVGYIVGEQGPELFMPEGAGEVVSASNTEEALAGAAEPVNVTFNINAIDSSNMEEMLTDQRENIINMIRTVANNQGSGFLEEVDTGY